MHKFYHHEVGLSDEIQSESIMRMEEATSKVHLKYTSSILSSLAVTIVLISLGFATIFLCDSLDSSFGNELRARFPVLYQIKERPKVLEDNGNCHSHEQESSIELNNQRRLDKYAWSSELGGWTLRREISNFLRQELTTNDEREWGCIWPDDCKLSERLSKEDRIVDQLKLSTNRYVSSKANSVNDGDGVKLFKILPPTSFKSYPIGQEIFVTELCPINRCSITYDKEEADVLIFENSDVVDEPPNYRRIDQVWIAYLLESPCHTFDRRFKRLYRGNGQFNWTASYRSDSDLVTPYSKFVPFQEKVNEYNSLKLFAETFTPSFLNLSESNPKIFDMKTILSSSLTAKQKSLIRAKQNKVAWFVSNCNAANNRLEYARELANYIQLDIYGRCGNFTCDKWNQTGCFDMINNNYKFYLSFENSNCRQYITEKLFRNALGYNDLNHLLLPIVMGAPKEDYQRFAPPASFIHVEDFESPKALAEYLKHLDSDDELYYSYFHWKALGQFIDTKFMCRVCSLIHDAQNRNIIKTYSNIEQWWTTCTDKDDETTWSTSGSCCIR